MRQTVLTAKTPGEACNIASPNIDNGSSLNPSRLTVHLVLKSKTKTWVLKKLTMELLGILNWAIQGCLEWQQQGLNPPQVILDQVSAHNTEMDSIAQFVEQECSLAAEAKYPASRLYENYRHYCQVLGRKPQSNSAFKKALDKLVNVYQSRSSSGMQWHGIEPLMQV